MVINRVLFLSTVLQGLLNISDLSVLHSSYKDVVLQVISLFKKLLLNTDTVPKNALISSLLIV